MARNELWIDGSWRAPGGGEWSPSTSPSSGEVFAQVAVGTPDDIDAAVAAAGAAFPRWAAMSAFGRAAACRAVAASIAESREELARALSLDQGKPLFAEAYAEVDELVEYFLMAAGDGQRVEGSLPASVSADRRVLVQRVPLGVVGVVSPWNWPYTMAAELVAPALAAGNTVVWVPAPSTAACSALLAGLIGPELPAGVFNFVPGAGPVVGDALAGHPGVNAIGFVGSVATGSLVSIRAAGKTQLLELGGNGPFVVLDDADMELVVPAVLEAAYLCAGQSCTAGECFLVQRSVRADFTEAVLAATAAQVRLGDPFDPATTMGPLNNQTVAAKVRGHVDQAVGAGARLASGGRPLEGMPTELYFQPTVIDQVTMEMQVAREETFGPVVAVVEVAGEAEALAIANASPYGLTAAVFSADLERALRFAEAARYGWVNINASTNLWESHLPFGGRSGSSSGRGRVGGRYPIEAFTEPKTITFPLGTSPLGTSPLAPPQR
jgi:acyl-CoA reductase-like NAD-dependent aldehyde dehydrogenase